MTRLALAVCLAIPCLAAGESAAADKAPAVLAKKMKSLDGKTVDLAKKYKGKTLLIVNVASKCGATPQYEDLQALHEKYADKGLAILGFPCNQFGKQEPGTAVEISTFCSEEYGIEFDLFAKIEVNGKEAAPLYKYLTSKAAVGKDAGPVRWNFEKFLVAADGTVVKRFRTGINPSSPEVVKAIEAELAK